MMPVAGWSRCVPKRDVIEDVHLSIPQRSESVRRSLGFYTWSRGLNRTWQEALTYVLHPKVCALDTCAHGILRMKSAQVSSHRHHIVHLTHGKGSKTGLCLCAIISLYACACVCVCVCVFARGCARRLVSNMHSLWMSLSVAYSHCPACNYQQLLSCSGYEYELVE